MYVNIWQSHSYVDLPKLLPKVKITIFLNIFLYIHDFSSVNLKGSNQFWYDSAVVHNVSFNQDWDGIWMLYSAEQLQDISSYPYPILTEHTAYTKPL